ncbi:glycoside hydrolase family 2 TIM barrel-domain containing protein [Mucilaginibacter sabulilitoris]|uniref:Glycoside hydrolase family 2 TIM barrel-domain containing protein n=1 Tax=Mucilaginibacter sabulilitoris TaxID=1173583 RepID=A0ABZ0TPF6_9SPHI|nr:sugar-binding domain-containing protein [Mucilaginibacter sabulilitoris]WPU94749.1 glycoside hydrolase family 2 TIM barrel-domain containing protein [Mucilaginibacter sabulilitoris]
MKGLKYLLSGSFLLWGCLSYGQQKVQFTAPFAPTSQFLNTAEKPFRDNISLNGTWRFAPVQLPAGFKEGVDPAPELPAFTADRLDKTPIRIPSPWNVNSFADKNGQAGDFVTFPSYPKTWEGVKMGWLYRKFQVPRNWKGKQVTLHFEAVAGDAEILVNGKPVGHHFEIFLPFDLDISKDLNYGGENEITVGIRKSSLFDHRGEHGRRTYQAGSFWGQHIAGIWQDVEIVATPMVDVKEVYIWPKVGEGKLSARVTVRNNSDKPSRFKVGGNVYEWHNLAPDNVLEGPVPHGILEREVALSLPVKEVVVPAYSEIIAELEAPVAGQLRLWSPATPNLYGLIVKITQNGKAVDQKFTRFGWRETKLSGKDFLLNGSPMVLKGDSWHFMGIPQMTRRYAWAWFKALKAANLNAVRLHAEPYPSFYLDMADEMGVMVLDESAMWASDGGPKLDDPAYWKDSEDHMAGLVLRDRNHPSIFGWSISNEIMPVVRGVMHDPPGMRDELIRHYSVWADTCRKLDPSRPWISADGEDDGEGRLPVYIVHYGGFNAMDRGLKSSKPWGVGEAGNAYYGTPEQVAGTNGGRAYESFLGRMEGVAVSSYQSLAAQRERKAAYRSVFNLVWYGLQPLALGMHDTTGVPQPGDGVFFSNYREGVEGVQPERLGPYATTLNPGYDPGLPLYRTWPLFEAIRDASADKPGPSRWAKVEVLKQVTQAPDRSKTFRVMGGEGSILAEQLATVGLLTGQQANGKEDLLIIDGLNPPGKKILNEVRRILKQGGKILVWGGDPKSLSKLNMLLPAPMTLVPRSASSLLIRNTHTAVAGMGHADFYFSEQSPAELIVNGIGGPLVQGAKVILEDCNTDWLKWNKQPEYAKTAMILRSEREKKPEGLVLLSRQSGQGEWLITTFPTDSRLLKVQLAIRKILGNLGLPLNQENAAAGALKEGALVHVLRSDILEAANTGEAVSKNLVDFNKAAVLKNGAAIGNGKWAPVYNAQGRFTFGGSPAGSQTNVIYLSCWIDSPRSLEDLLLEPNLPTVNLEVNTNGITQIWLNGAVVLQNVVKGSRLPVKSHSSPLKLRQGWNHLLIKLVQTQADWQFSGKLLSNQPDFINTLQSAIEKP